MRLQSSSVPTGVGRPLGLDTNRMHEVHRQSRGVSAGTVSAVPWREEASWRLWFVSSTNEQLHISKRRQRRYIKYIYRMPSLCSPPSKDLSLWAM